MGRKKNKPPLGLDTRDTEAVKTAFLAMRVRASQAASRANRCIRHCGRLEAKLHHLNLEMQVARQSLVTLQKDLDDLLHGLDLARAAELRALN